jgi:excinuclease ABC subunit C
MVVHSALSQGTENIRTYAKTLPYLPGIYRMLDTQGTILYIGKAKELRKRVTSYTRTDQLSTRIQRMVSLTHTIEYERTQNEAEALLLEAVLIKKHQPRFNILLKDDSKMPYIRLTQDHDFPRLMKYRGTPQKPHLYFGPFADSFTVNDLLIELQKIFLLRTCTDSVFRNRTRPCLLYDIKRCSAPCVNKINQSDYKDLMQQMHSFLYGKSDKLQKNLEDLMHQASINQQYEQAGQYRDRLRIMTKSLARQSVYTPLIIKKLDVFAVTTYGQHTCVQGAFFRSGRLHGRKAYFFKEDFSLDTFIGQFYVDHPVADCILLSAPLDNTDLCRQALLLKKNDQALDIAVPKRGLKADLMKQIAEAAQKSLKRHLSESASSHQNLTQLQTLLNLPDPIKRIEVYDNSHLRGTHMLGAMIVADEDGFAKKHYRLFKDQTNTVTKGDDYGMMTYVLKQRFRSGGSSPTLPDVMIVDGGKGQLSVTQTALTELNLTHLCVLCVAKGENRNASEERFFTKDGQEIIIPKDSGLFYYIQRLRDEAHRFAIGSHRKSRQKQAHHSSLEDIEGVGPALRKRLMLHFGSLAAIKSAGSDDLARIVGPSMAARIYHTLHEETE